MRIGIYNGPSSLRQALSIDRVDATKGYTSDNFVLCTYKANAIKQDLTLVEIQDWLPKWYERLKVAGFVK